VSRLFVHGTHGSAGKRTALRVRVLRLPFLPTPPQRAQPHARQRPTTFSFLLTSCHWLCSGGCYKRGFHDVAQLLLQRGFDVTHETIRLWEFRFAPLVSMRLRAKRRDEGDHSWYIAEIHVKGSGRWRSLYRAIDRHPRDSMLSA